MSNRVPSYCRRPTTSGTGKRVLWILAVGAVAAAAVSMFSGRRSHDQPATLAPTEKMAHMSARRLQSHAADSGVAGGAAAAQRALAARPPAEGPDKTVPVSVEVRQPADRPAHPEAVAAPAAEPTNPRPGVAIRLAHVRSDAPHATREAALNDALTVARMRLGEQLRAMDPPIYTLPKLETVRNDYLRPESVREVPVTDPKIKEEWQKVGVDPNRMYVEVDVEVTDAQVRQLRGERRLESASLYAVIAFVVVAAVYGFLRLDAWTKGYLTAGLGFGIAGTAVAAVVLLLLVIG